MIEQIYSLIGLQTNMTTFYFRVTTMSLPNRNPAPNAPRSAVGLLSAARAAGTGVVQRSRFPGTGVVARPGNVAAQAGTGVVVHPRVPGNVAAQNQMLYEHFRIFEERQAAQIRERHRQEAVAIYEGTTKVFGKPARTDIDPERWSPATLKELSAEALRRKIFIQEWIDAGGKDTFGKGRVSKFDRSVIRRVTEESFLSFQFRIKQWLDLNPRPRFPALPESLPWSDDSSDSSPGENWSIDQLVRNHRFYAPSPDRTGTVPATVSDESDSSVEILKEIKK